MAFNRCELRFREVERTDLEWLREWRNDPEMSAGWRDPRSVQTLDLQERWYSTLGQNNQAFLAMDSLPRQFTMPKGEKVTVNEDRSIGLLRFTLDLVNNEARITGIDVDPQQGGHGYGKRILRAGLEYVMQDLGYHRATGEALDTNKGAQKIILACGMKQEGTLRQYVWRGGEWHDWFIYSILRSELWPEDQGVAAG